MKSLIFILGILILATPSFAAYRSMPGPGTLISTLPARIPSGAPAKATPGRHEISPGSGSGSGSGGGSGAGAGAPGAADPVGPVDPPACHGSATRLTAPSPCAGACEIVITTRISSRLSNLQEQLSHPENYLVGDAYKICFPTPMSDTPLDFTGTITIGSTIPNNPMFIYYLNAQQVTAGAAILKVIDRSSLVTIQGSRFVINRGEGISVLNSPGGVTIQHNTFTMNSTTAIKLTSVGPSLIGARNVEDLAANTNTFNSIDASHAAGTALSILDDETRRRTIYYFNIFDGNTQTIRFSDAISVLPPSIAVADAVTQNAMNCEKTATGEITARWLEGNIPAYTGEEVLVYDCIPHRHDDPSSSPLLPIHYLLSCNYDGVSKCHFDLAASSAIFGSACGTPGFYIRLIPKSNSATFFSNAVQADGTANIGTFPTGDIPTVGSGATMGDGRVVSGAGGSDIGVTSGGGGSNNSTTGAGDDENDEDGGTTVALTGSGIDSGGTSPVEGGTDLVSVTGSSGGGGSGGCSLIKSHSFEVCGLLWCLIFLSPAAVLVIVRIRKN